MSITEQQTPEHPPEETIVLAGLEVSPARASTLERFHKAFYTNNYVKSSVEKMLESEEDRIEAQGLIMNPEEDTALIVRASPWLQGMIERYKGVEWIDYNIQAELLDRLETTWHPLIVNGGTYSPRMIKKILTILDVVDKGGTPLLKVLAKEDMPIILRGVGQETIILAPVNATDDRGKTKDEMENEALERIHARYEAIEDPNKVYFVDKDGNDHIQPTKNIKKIVQSHLGYLVYLKSGERLIVTEEAVKTIQEAKPKVKMEDNREPYTISPQLRETFFEAWLKHDPAYTDPVGFNEALDALAQYKAEHRQDPCSYEFWSLHWREDAPTPMSKYRSIYTINEWAKALLEMATLGDMVFFKVTSQRQYEENWKSEGPYTRASVTFTVEGLPPELLNGMDITVKPAKYKASHLKQYVADVEMWRDKAGDSHHSWWELLDEVKDFERIYVHP